MTDCFPAGKYTVEVLYLDNHLLCVCKPPNLPVQADSTGDMDLLTAAKAYIGKKFNKPGAVYLGLVHRLDRPVGGVMVLARTSKAAARLSAAIANRKIEKQYLAVLQGNLQTQCRLEDYLIKDSSSGNVRVTSPDTPGAKNAILTTYPVMSRDNLTLTRVELETGRSHQIRVQHAALGYPIWGDARYGHGKPGQQIALWAYRLQLEHPVTHNILTLTALPPLSGGWFAFGSEIQSLAEDSSGTDE